MEREVIKFTKDELKYFPYENIEGFKFIQEESTYFDGEKGYTNYDVIMQRKSDSKFFKGSYEDWGAGDKEVELKWEEVFPKQVTITVYE